MFVHGAEKSGKMEVLHVPQSLWEEAMAIPTLPVVKGEMRKVCGKVPKGRWKDERKNKHGSLHVTHALKGNARTYVVCKASNGSKKLWFEITAKKHEDHARMVEAIVDLAVKYDWNKKKCLECRERILDSWPNFVE